MVQFHATIKLPACATGALPRLHAFLCSESICASCDLECCEKRLPALILININLNRLALPESYKDEKKKKNLFQCCSFAIEMQVKLY
jgi:hypothetical protein